jgi:hypothetical protein
MMDYKNYGYIIPAWDEINIIADSTGALVFLGEKSTKRPQLFPKAKKMDRSLADGIFEVKDGVPLEVWHLATPWTVQVKNKNMSACIVPAFYHSNFLDDLYIYPGIVDYGNFTHLNMIFSVRRKCKITIPAGAPLLQVMPFESKNVRTVYGPVDDHEKDKNNSYISTTTQFYRKYVMFDKSSKLERKEVL